MKRILFLTAILWSLIASAQFKGANVRKFIPNCKPYHLKLFSIYPTPIDNNLYVITGKIPGKAEIGFLIRDKTDKLSFSSIGRFWSRSKKIRPSDDYAMQLAVRECTPPKGYDGEILEEKFVTISETELMYWRKYKKAFNAKEQDSVEMIQVSYVATHPSIKNEIVTFDLFNIGTNLSVDSTIILAKKYIAFIKPNTALYNKKWGVETDVNILFGTQSVETELAYVKKDNLGNSYFYKLALNSGNLSGPALVVSRHLKQNFWLKAGIGVHAGREVSYDSLYKRGDYYLPPILYDVTFSSSDVNYVKLGFEKKFYLGKRHSINAVANMNYSFGNINFKMTGKQTISGPQKEYLLEYKNSPGFDLGVKYQFYFSNQRWGFDAGFKYLYSAYEIKSYKVDGVESDIETSPYFFKKMNKLDISGLEFFIGGFVNF